MTSLLLDDDTGSISLLDLHEVQVAARRWAQGHLRGCSEADVFWVRDAMLHAPAGGRISRTALDAYLDQLLRRPASAA